VARWIPKPPRCVVTLEDTDGLFETEAARCLLSGYKELMARDPNRLPDRHALDLAPFPAAIPHFALCAIKLPDQCIYRIVGEQLKRRLGFNPTGRNYYDLVPEERRESACAAMNMVVRQPSGFRAEIEQVYSDGRIRIVEALALPLAGNAPEVDGYILFADQQIGNASRAFDTDSPVLLGANVINRDLIDLGFGVDRAFRDLVRQD